MPVSRKIRITLPDGQTALMDVVKVEFLNTCPHCDLAFEAEDYRKQYPTKSHRSMDSRYRRIVKEPPSNLSGRRLKS